MPARVALVAALLLASGCFFARTDARVRPGFHVGASGALLYAPDARVHHEERDDSDGNNLRGAFQLSAGRAFESFDLTLHMPLPQLMPHDEYGENPYPDDVFNWLFSTVSARWDLYLPMKPRTPWTWGVGLELAVAPGAYAIVTRELGSGALSATARLVTGEQTALHGQLAYVLPGTGSTISAFAAIFQPLSDDYDIRAASLSLVSDRTRAGTFGLVGLTVTLERPAE